MYLDPTLTFHPADQKTPAFRLSETLLEQGSGATNDDALAITEDRFIVCDGATSLGSDGGPKNSSGGRLAAEIAANVIAGDTLSDSPSDLAGRVHRANREIRQAMRRHGVDLSRRESLWSTSFAAVHLDGDEISWCQSGDCLILLIYLDGTSKLVTSPPGQDVAVLERWKRIGASRRGSIHQELAEDIAAVRRMTNRRFGSLNGEPEALDFVAAGREDLRPVRDILLFSDGLFPPSRFPDQPFDEETFVALFLSSGLDGVKDHIRSIQQGDPRCFRYPRFKMFDDMSGISVTRC